VIRNGVHLCGALTLLYSPMLVHEAEDSVFRFSDFHIARR